MADTDQHENGTSSDRPQRRRRATRLFPALSFKEALLLGEAVQEHGAGQAIRRLTLFEALDRSPEGGTTRKLITSSGQYGITTGSYNAEWIDLTAEGRMATSPTAPARAQLEARAQLAINNVPPFNEIYERYKGSRLPSVEVLRDAARQYGVPEESVAECVEIFLANLRDLGLVRTIGGSEHLLTIETILDEVESDRSPALPEVREEEEALVSRTREPQIALVPPSLPAEPQERARPTRSGGPDLSKVCFVISPIGDPGTEIRKHADLVLSTLIEPALEGLGLRPVRADKISRPGLITGQVIDHLTRAGLVIADLSYGNPNVYYELALRHAVRRPLVQLSRTADKLPFDVNQFRTVVIDMTDIYTLVPQLDLHRQEIARQCRAAMEEGAMAESPLSRFYPDFWAGIAS